MLLRYNQAAGLFVLLLLFCVTQISAQSLRVLDPQQAWNSQQGTIEQAAVTIHPKGVYMEYGLYLTISARGSGLSAQNLEIEHFFELPEAAIVIDSWLWLGDQILRAEIIDTWTGSEIYEGIVNRNQDPSILYKRGPTQYELRVFPLAPDGFRKVKITYLLPADWSQRNVVTPLPTGLLESSRTPVDLDVISFEEEAWDTPTVPVLDLAFDDPFDPGSGSRRKATIRAQDYENTRIDLVFEAPYTDGIFVSQVSHNEENFYQLAVMPGTSLPQDVNQHVAVLFDFDAGKTSVTREEFIQGAQDLLSVTLSSADRFNVLISGTNTKVVSETWLPGDALNIASVFNSVESDLNNYSSLPSLLADGIQFLNDSDSGGSILLISASDLVSSQEVADGLIQDLRNAVEVLPPIHVVDASDRGSGWTNVGGFSYYGNGYLYERLARLSEGSHHSTRDESSYFDAISAAVGSVRGVIKSFDLHTDRENGFCFDRHSPVRDGEDVRLDRAVIEFGKCSGSGAFTVEASGLFQSTPFSSEFRIDESALKSDSTLATMWSGQEIASLERLQQSNDVIGRILDLSLENRILSYYTVFLALEPSLGGEVCETCEDESGQNGEGVNAEDDLANVETSLTAYPNPFRDFVTVKATFAAPTPSAGMTAQIYNAMGQLVKTLEIPEQGSVNSLEIVWDGTDDAGAKMASGTYFFVLTTPVGRHTLTLTLVR